jgi:hypothetical protein
VSSLFRYREGNKKGMKAEILMKEHAGIREEKGNKLR